MLKLIVCFKILVIKPFNVMTVGVFLSINLTHVAFPCEERYEWHTWCRTGFWILSSFEVRKEILHFKVRYCITKELLQGLFLWEEVMFESTMQQNYL